jgi:presenilin-like A22 family membrane protease
MYAVWKSKHIITLAKFQTKAKVFSGLLIPYQLPKKVKNAQKEKGKIVHVRMAMLGGGDIGFPLLFAGVVMIKVGFIKSLLIPLFAAIALLLLMAKSSEKKFYPAMPFLTIGCLVGYALVIVV